MMTDPIADMLTRIRNGIRMHHEQVVIPYSGFKEACLALLCKEGFLTRMQTAGEKTGKTLVVWPKYGPGGKAVINMLRRASTPSRRFYSGYEELKEVRHGLGLRILTTSKGILTDKEARQLKIGGEILLEVW